MWDDLRGFWRNYALSWSRLGKDRRARTVFVRGTFLLIWIPLSLFFASGLILPRDQQTPQLLFNAFISGLGFIAFLGIRRLNRRDDASLNTSITGVEYAVPPSTHEVHSELRDYLAERTLIVSSLLARALGELRAHADQQRSADSSVRQVLNQALRRRELWSKLEAAEAELAALPQGDWSASDNILLVEWAEQLRLLRWGFQLDRELLPLGVVPRLDDLFAVELRGGFHFQPSNVFRPPWELRLERDSAHLYLARTLAELEARQLLPPTPTPEGLQELRAKLAGPSTDLLVDNQAIEELSESELCTLAASALARFDYADYLTELLDKSAVMSFSHWRERKSDSGL